MLNLALKLIDFVKFLNSVPQKRTKNLHHVQLNRDEPDFAGLLLGLNAILVILSNLI